jgi:hypothetical protein
LLDYLRSCDRSKNEKYSAWDRVKEILFEGRKTADVSGFNLNKEQKAIAQDLLADIVFIPFVYGILSSVLASHYGIWATSRPLIHLEPISPRDFLPGRVLQMKLDADTDATGMIAVLYRWVYDAYAYGMGAVAVDWVTRYHNRIVPVVENLVDIRTRRPITKIRRETRKTVNYEGTMVKNIRPEDFFTDSSYKVSRFQSGRFAAHRYIESADNIFELKDKVYFNVDHIMDKDGITAYDETPHGLEAVGPHDKLFALDPDFQRRHVELFEIQAKVRPSKYNLLPSGSEAADSIQTWLFTIAPNGVIVRSEPLDNLHGKFTYAALEPFPLTDDYISPGLVELLEPLQDEINFLVNSHRMEVRRNIRGTVIYRKDAVDFRGFNPFRMPPYLPTKPHYRGGMNDIHTTIEGSRVTGDHLQGLGIFIESAERASGVSSLMQSIPIQGSRTATEVGSLQQASVSRLQVLAGLMGATGLRDLGEMIAMDNQQYLNENFIAKVAGPDADIVQGLLQQHGTQFFGQNLFEASPVDIIGNFRFPAYNPMYPAHQVLQAESWVRAFEAITNVSPALREQGYTINFQKMLEEYFRSLGRTQDIPQIIQQISQEEMAAKQQQQVQAAGAEAALKEQAKTQGQAALQAQKTEGQSRLQSEKAQLDAALEAARAAAAEAPPLPGVAA